MMSSLLRNLTPTLRQWLELRVIRSCSCHQVRFCQHLPISSFSSELREENESTKTAGLKAAEGSLNRWESKGHLKRKVTQSRYAKLHNRTLTMEEVEQDALLEKEMASIPPEQLYGSLSKIDKPKSSTAHQLQSNFKMDMLAPELGESAKPTQQEKHFSSSARKSKQTNSRYGLTGMASSTEAWANTFGTLQKHHSGRWMEDDFETEDTEDREQDYLSSEDEGERPYRRLRDDGQYSANWYGRQMRDFARQGKIKEAIDVLDVWMLKNDRVRPNYYVFSMLISILGKAGYTKKAFQVFNQMKKMGIKPKDNTYTALFNACSNSPWHGDGLQRARNLHSLMVEKRHRPNLITYRAMIKAYGVCGDLRTAFALLDEASRRFKPDVRCFSFLLMACCSDKESGFRHAIMVWRLLRQYGLKPDLPLYNLLLRAIRDCGVGDTSTAAELIHSNAVPQNQLDGTQQSGVNTHRLKLLGGSCVDGISQTNPNVCINTSHDFMVHKRAAESTDRMLDSDCGRHTEEKHFLTIKNIEESNNVNVEISTLSHEENNRMVTLKSETAVPELLSILESPISSTEASIVSVNLDMLESAEARLALVGGMKGILRSMSDNQVTPDIKSMTQLVNCIPDNTQAEDELLHALTQNAIKPDVDFFNILIRKRNLRHDYAGAKELLAVISEHKLLPNMTTFGCLAMGCRRKADGLQLLKDMQAYGLSPNQAIFTILVYNSADDFAYKLSLIREMQALDLPPTDKLLMYTEKRLQISKQAILNQERGIEVSPYYRTNYFHHGYKKFLEFYDGWLRSTPVDKGEHPWAMFRHPPAEKEATPTEEEDELFVRNV